MREQSLQAFLQGWGHLKKPRLGNIFRGVYRRERFLSASLSSALNHLGLPALNNLVQNRLRATKHHPSNSVVRGQEYVLNWGSSMTQISSPCFWRLALVGGLTAIGRFLGIRAVEETLKHGWKGSWSPVPLQVREVVSSFCLLETWLGQSGLIQLNT